MIIATISTFLAICEGIHPWITTEGFSSQGDFLVFFDVRVIKLLNKQSICWYIKKPWCSVDVTVIRVIPLQWGSECYFGVHSGYGLCQWETILHCNPRSMFTTLIVDDDVIKWKNSPHKGQWRGALAFSLICAGTNGWVNNLDAGDLRRHRAHYESL